MNILLLILIYSSRDANESSFIRDSNVEIPKVIFDKIGVIRFRESDFEKQKAMIQERIQELKNIYGHHSRVIKYVKRGLYIEAYGYYQKYVVTPLVELIRLKYTPDYSDYYIVHISHHIPKDVLNQLEKYFKVSTVDEIYDMTLNAEGWFNSLYNELKDKNSYA